MKIFSTAQVALLDKFTIENEPITSVDLMERASAAFVDCLLEQIPYEGSIQIFCGPGNNGGDGLVIARLLSLVFRNRTIDVFLLDLGKGFTPSFEINLKRLKEHPSVNVLTICSEKQFPTISNENIVVDALFGSGLSRPLSGIAVNLVQHINNAGVKVFAVDIPSGLMGEDNSLNNPDHIIKAAVTITFQFPKLSFLLPENEKFVGDWHVVNIDLHSDGLQKTPSPFHLLEFNDVKSLIKPRSKFSHKGTFGHALLISGSYGKMGASVLASRACLGSGVGLLTTHLPHNEYQILQIAVPEAMTSIDESDTMFTGIHNLEPYSAIGVGPAIGQHANTQHGFHQLIKMAKVPMVIDADAINILGLNPEWLIELPAGTILTPHPKEFERIAGKSVGSYHRLQLAMGLAQKFKLNIVLKGAYTQIVNPQGEVWFNTTGNAGMATGGSGDVLTGIILAWIAQGYSPEDAAKIGVYTHGMAGDISCSSNGEIALIASDIIDNLGDAYERLTQYFRPIDRDL